MFFPKLESLDCILVFCLEDEEGQVGRHAEASSAASSVVVEHPDLSIRAHPPGPSSHPRRLVASRLFASPDSGSRAAMVDRKKGADTKFCLPTDFLRVPSVELPIPSTELSRFHPFFVVEEISIVLLDILRIDTLGRFK